MNKNTIKKITRAIVRWSYYLCFWLFSILPLEFIFAISDGLIATAFLFLGRMREYAKESLTIAFGKEKSAKEIHQILRSCFFNLGRSAIELFCYVQRPWLISKRMHLTAGSRENLDRALKDGKGIVGISAHFGNFPLMLIHLSQSGYPVHAIIRPMRDQRIQENFTKLYTKMEFRTILSYPRDTCVRQSFKALRAKEIVVILMDQNTGSKSGIFVDFFGKKAGTPTGAVIFAMRTGAPILPMFTVREGQGSHKIIIEPHFYLEQKSSDEETLHHNVQKITAIIEKYVRQYPTEWAWMHRRWKSQPNDAPN